MMNLRKTSSLALAISALAITGCSDSDNNNPIDQEQQEDQQQEELLPESSFETTTIDASDYDNYKYFNLTTGELVELSADSAATSTAWHIGLRRTGIIVNGGDSGSGNVEAALAAAQDDFYDAEGAADANVFMNATADSEEEHLLATYDLTSLEFSADAIVSAIEGIKTDEDGDGIYDYGWYNYDSSSHQTSLNSDNWWMLKSNGGASYAKFHATAYDRSEGLAATFEFFVQAEGETVFSDTAVTFDLSIPSTGGVACFDFDTGTTVDCETSTEWDLQVDFPGRSPNLWVNGGVTADGNGAAFGPFTSEAIAEYDSGNVKDGTDFSRHYSSDSSEGVFSENSWYAYSLAGNHKLWPNFRTYIVDTDTTDEAAAKYKLQVINYYSELDTSGHLTIRYEAN
jgi:hypothetical protein